MDVIYNIIHELTSIFFLFSFFVFLILYIILHKVRQSLSSYFKFISIILMMVESVALIVSIICFLCSILHSVAYFGTSFSHSFFVKNSPSDNLGILVDVFGIAIGTFTAIAALRISIVQSHKEDFNFYSNLDFHNIEGFFNIKKIDPKDKKEYKEIKETFPKNKIKNYSQNDYSIYVLIFKLKEALNPQIKYKLNSLMVCNGKLNFDKINRYIYIYQLFSGLFKKKIITSICRQFNILNGNNFKYYDNLSFSSKYNSGEYLFKVNVEEVNSKNIYESPLSVISNPDSYKINNFDNITLLLDFKVSSYSYSGKHFLKKKRFKVLLNLEKQEVCQNDIIEIQKNINTSNQISINIFNRDIKIPFELDSFEKDVLKLSCNKDTGTYQYVLVHSQALL